MAKELLQGQLIDAYNELDKIAGINPPVKWKTQDQFERELWSCVYGGTDQKVAEEGDKFTEEAQAVFDELGRKYGKGFELYDPDDVPNVIEPKEPESEESDPEPEPEEKPAPKPKSKAKPKASSKKQPAKKVEKEPESEPEEKPAPKPKAEKKVEVDMENVQITDRVDALCMALEMNPDSIDDWSRRANSILEIKGGKIKPNNLANKFDIGYFYKIAKHFDLGELPKS
jgi:hypothetical protein